MKNDVLGAGNGSMSIILGSCGGVGCLENDVPSAGNGSGNIILGVEVGEVSAKICQNNKF